MRSKARQMQLAARSIHARFILFYTAFFTLLLQALAYFERRSLLFPSCELQLQLGRPNPRIHARLGFAERTRSRPRLRYFLFRFRNNERRRCWARGPVGGISNY